VKSGKQRCAEIKAARRLREEKRQLELRPAIVYRPAGAIVPVDLSKLDFGNSYGQPLFASGGFYIDQPFQCRDCGIEGVWAASQQKWWFEVAQGGIYSQAIRCKACRQIERERVAQARQAYVDGMLRKLQRMAAAH
jgi:hypothetical protein